jgi:hypothetical protein
MQSRFFIEILTLKPYEISNPCPTCRLADCLFSLTPCFVLSRPSNFAFLIGQLLRGAQMIVLIKRDLVFAEGLSFQLNLSVP